jgi:hypothetical protein
MTEHKRFTLARVASAMPILVAVFSLLLTVYEARSARQSRLVSVWPRLGMSISDTAGHFYREVANFGVGPALVRSVHVYVDEKPVRDWGAMLKAVLTDVPKGNWYYSSFGRGSVLLPSGRLQLLGVVSDSIAARLVTAEARIKTVVCYCSLYEECWTLRSDEPDPTPIDACAGPDATEFGR